ncbi:SLAP domain-containing protein [Companilactobacillus muriivasis]|uniref:SLAP domain-containing protein n=1 Tax=Companilactobacillus muriivasis TaxID=3081444 RepID=UPI0030C76B3C
MKLKLDKVTMSCVAVLSSAILFGVNSNVVKADSGGEQGTVSAVQLKDDTPIASGEPDGYGSISWAVYTTNEDTNNLQLRLGNPDGKTVEKLGKTTGTGNNGWMPYANKITSVVIVGDVKASGVAQYLFSGLSKLQKISGLSLLDTSDTTDFSYMFYDDTSLESIDLSEIDMSSAKTTTNMLQNTNLSSITLGKNSVINKANLSSDPFTYSDGGTYFTASGWKDSSDAKNYLSTELLMERYSTGNTDRTQTTWVPNDPTENTNFKIQYIDNDSGEVLFTYDEVQHVLLVSQNQNIDLTNYTLAQINQLQPGYAGNSIENLKTGQIEPDGNGGYIVKAYVKKVSPVQIKVTQTVGTDKPKDASFDIQKNDTRYKYSDISNPSNGVLDLDKSTIKVGNDEAKSFNDYVASFEDQKPSVINPNPIEPPEKNLNSILSTAINTQLRLDQNKVFGDNSSENPITVDAVYTKTSSGGDNGNSGGSSNGNHNNGNHNNNENNNQSSSSKDVNQTISTATKLVNIYDEKGKLVTDRVLDKDSAWFSDQEYTLNGTQYYRVSTGEYVKASDVYVYTALNQIQSST